MIYRFFKTFHKITLAISALCLVFAAGTSDAYVLGRGTVEPEYVITLIEWGFIMLIPSAFYYLLDWAKNKI